MYNLVASAATAVLLLLSQGAYAGSYVFSGSGSSGTLIGATETWTLGCPSGCPFGLSGWGSPGVSLGTTAYGEAKPAIDFEITFEGATIDEAQVIFGNGAGCVGMEFGGTTFCSDPVIGGTPWTATLSNDDHTIHFVAPAGVSLLLGHPYFVNIFLDGDVRAVSFSGAWSTPEPSTLVLLAVALVGVAAGTARQRRTSS